MSKRELGMYYIGAIPVTFLRVWSVTPRKEKVISKEERNNYIRYLSLKSTLSFEVT